MGSAVKINSQSLEDTQVGYILQKYTLDKYTLAQKSLVMVAKVQKCKVQSAAGGKWCGAGGK